MIVDIHAKHQACHLLFVLGEMGMVISSYDGERRELIVMAIVGRWGWSGDGDGMAIVIEMAK